MNLSKKISGVIMLSSLIAICFLSCQKDQKNLSTEKVKTDTVSAAIIAKIKAAGFSTNGVTKVKNGYLVEGDIVLTDAYLNSNNTPPQKIITTGVGGHNTVLATDQYSVTNPINPPHSSQTTYKILVSSGMGQGYNTALDAAIGRYNNLNLCIRFIHVATGPADITIYGYTNNGSSLQAYSGFPTNGVVYNSISMNSYWFGTNPQTTQAILFTASVIQHEIGHCIGMRHTDYANSAYSCGGPANNEGAGSEGAVLIPGTPSGPDAASWMLACNDGVSNRTFNSNDIIALNYLFPYITINGAGSYNWNNGNGGGSGTINANPGVLVHVTVSAYGPGTSTYFTVNNTNGGTLQGNPSGVIYMQNNSTTQTMIMPSSGSVTWNGNFTRTGSSGTGDIAVN